MVNWSPHLQTAVSDLEVEYTDEDGSLFFFKYPVEGSDDHLPVATTRPETILGDTAVAVNPNVSPPESCPYHPLYSLYHPLYCPYHPLCSPYHPRN
eukprot:1189664-Prorocentrum_minimum.AAC.1